MFSSIASKLHGEANALYRLRDELRAEGYVIRDLVSGNINDHGFVFPQDLLEEILVRGSRLCRTYRPDSFGRLEAREAISEYYKGCGVFIDPGCILVTPGTSMSYWYCFKLLADEGDEILCPCPSYPLLEYIAMLSGIKLISYRLDESRNWSIDIGYLESCVSTKTRALILISPHNPTGHVSSRDEISRLAEVACRHHLAVISDEVFGEFLFKEDFLPRPAESAAPLVFTLNGFSKMLALPGIKFGWMLVSGDSGKVRQAMRSLELISDTFLPVNEIVQACAPDLFKYGRGVTRNFSRRIRDCWNAAESLLTPSRYCSYTRPEGGFYVTLRLNELDEERVAEAVLRRNHCLVHPGYFYDMQPDHLVLSYVQEPGVIGDTIPMLLETMAEPGKLDNGHERAPKR
jgi:alanine-synthesizing transaminase